MKDIKLGNSYDPDLFSAENVKKSFIQLAIAFACIIILIIICRVTLDPNSDTAIEAKIQAQFNKYDRSATIDKIIFHSDKHGKHKTATIKYTLGGNNNFHLVVRADIKDKGVVVIHWPD